MKGIEKRLSALEAIAPDKESISYGELLRLQATPGTPENMEYLNLYNENRYNESEQTTPPVGGKK